MHARSGLALKSRLFTTSVLAVLGGAAVPLGSAVLAQALIASPAAAQDYTTANLSGAVVDASGKPVPGASVSLRSGQGATRSATAGDNGRFQIPALSFGAYRAHVTAPGYAPTDTTVTVSPSGSSYTFTLSAAQAEVSEVVVTGKARATQDFTRTDTGLTVDVPDIVTRVPVAHNVTSLVMLTPGATAADAGIVANGVRRGGQSAVALSGTSAAESAYYINGLNVTDQRTFLGFAELPFDAIQTMEVKTGGYSAEFGRATGGVVNIVTKSGSNDFHAGGSIFYTPRALSGHSPNGYAAGTGGLGGAIYYNRYASTDLVDSDVYASGPLWKDHLFFFGILNPRRLERSQYVLSDGPPGTPAAQTGVQYHYSDKTPRWLGKLDFNITDRQRLEATVFSDAGKELVRVCQFQIGKGCVSDGLPVQSKSGGVNQIYKYTGVWTDWFTLSALYGQVRSQYTDEGPAPATAMVLDESGGPNAPVKYLTAALNRGPFDVADQDVRDTYRVDADFYVNLFGPHHIRLGADDEKLSSTDLSLYSGGSYFNVRNTAFNHVPGGSGYSGDYVRMTTLHQAGSFTADQKAFYVEDSWRPLDGLTLQLGLRNDVYAYKTAAGQTFINIKDQFAPRLGFTYDVFHNGDDKLYGSFGRYYLPVAENTAIREATSAPYYRDYFAVSRDASGNIVMANGRPVLGRQIAPRQVYASADVPDPRTIASQNIQPMYTEEFILGYEHRFEEGPLANWKAGIRYVDRKLAATIEDTDLQNVAGDATSYGDGAIGRYCKRVGISAAQCNTASYEGVYTLINPGFSQRVWVDPDGKGARYIELTKDDFGFPRASNHYRAVELTFERPFDGKWSLQGSYVYAKSLGNYEGAVKSDIGQTDTSITQDFDNAYVEEGAYGYLPNDHRHTVKVFGSYSPIENLMVGANLTAQSGRHFGCIGYNPADPNPSPTPSEWFCANAQGVDVPTPRGSKIVTPWTYTLDMNLSYRIPTPDRYGSTTLSLEVFNLLGGHGVTRIQEQGDIGGQPGERTVTYGMPRSYQDPRRVRLGVRYAF